MNDVYSSRPRSRSRRAASVPDRPLVRHALSCTLRRTDKEEDVDLRLDLVGIVVRDMRTSLEFYRRLGLNIPESAEDESHAEATTPSGVRVAWDTAELIRQIDPEWTDPTGGHRVALAFLCPDPACRRKVRRTCRPRLRAQRTLGRVLGTAVRFRQGPGRQPGRPLRAALDIFRAGLQDAPRPLLSVLASRRRKAGARICRLLLRPLPQDLRRRPRRA